MSKKKKKRNKLIAWKNKQKLKTRGGYSKYLNFDDEFKNHQFSGVKRPKKIEGTGFFTKKIY